MLVILVVAILAALLFPVFVRAHQATGKATCLSNVKLICQATLMYAADYNQTLPWASMDSDDSGFEHALPGEDRWDFDHPGRVWLLPDVISKYVADTSIWDCPTLSALDAAYKFERNAFAADSRHPALAGTAKVGVMADGRDQAGGGGSYGYFCMHHANMSKNGQPLYLLFGLAQSLGLVPQDADYQQYHCCGTKLAAYGRPEQHIMVFCDSWGVHEGYGKDYVNEHFPPPQLGGKEPTITGGTTLGYVDGHGSYERFDWRGLVTIFIKHNGE
jgi:type II secretory pathway pseudopilin PulG